MYGKVLTLLLYNATVLYIFTIYRTVYNIYIYIQYIHRVSEKLAPDLGLSEKLPPSHNPLGEGVHTITKVFDFDQIDGVSGMPTHTSADGWQR